MEKYTIAMRRHAHLQLGSRRHGSARRARRTQSGARSHSTRSWSRTWRPSRAGPYGRAMRTCARMLPRKEEGGDALATSTAKEAGGACSCGQQQRPPSNADGLYAVCRARDAIHRPVPAASEPRRLADFGMRSGASSPALRGVSAGGMRSSRSNLHSSSGRPRSMQQRERMSALMPPNVMQLPARMGKTTIPNVPRNFMQTNVKALRSSRSAAGLRGTLRMPRLSAMPPPPTAPSSGPSLAYSTSAPTLYAERTTALACRPLLRSERQNGGRIRSKARRILHT